MKRVSLVVFVLFGAARAGAAPTPWTFDFDPNIAEDPTYVNQHLNALKSGLPGLPPSGIHELISGQTKLYFYQDVIDALIRARDCGPGTEPAVTRTPQRCVEHFAFSKPSLLLDSPPFLCDLKEKAAMSAFDASKIKTCRYVEFPESYVYDYKQPSLILPTTTADIDVLMAMLGEALTHLIYPTNLVQPDFLPQARKIIAKLRRDKLKVELATRKQDYNSALGQLQTDSACYEPAALSAFKATVNKLIAELNAVEQDLDAIYNAGVAQAIADRKAIEAQGRMRADLPYPALTDRERELLAFYIGGLSWRVRGAGLIEEDKIPLGLAMSFVGPPFQIIADIAGGVDGKDVGFPLYVDENGGYYLWYDMGTDPGSNDKYADLVQMTNRGKQATNLTAPLLQGRGFDIRHLVAGGLMMGPCYFYIWEQLPDFLLGPQCTPDPHYPVPANLPGCLDGPHYMQFIMWPTATGEVCTGAALALGLTKTLLWGKPGKACTPSCHGKPCGADDTCGGTCDVCTDAGTAISPDSSVSLPDSGPPTTDADLTSTGDSSTQPGDERSDGQRTDGCGCIVGEHPLSALPAALALVLLFAVTRRG